MNNRGFTLAELAIVLLVVGLLVAGVLSGKKLVEASTIRKFITEVEDYKQKFIIFSSTYDAFPGDFNEAQSFWGSAGNLNNGDGDGNVEWDAEVFDVLLHMEKAGLTNQVGFSGSGTVYSADLSSFDGANLRFLNTNDFLGFARENRTVIQIGGGEHTDEAFFVPELSARIDRKMDDGLPKSGLVTFRIFLSTTDASCTDTSAQYHLLSNQVGCNFVYDIENSLPF